ncbi:hypothetical protein HBB16_09295 [Pseudonocardia sp. MCCB 268]|nr:hypothetical protein [Pseudonocardia cytotoxica]
MLREDLQDGDPRGVTRRPTPAAAAALLRCSITGGLPAFLEPNQILPRPAGIRWTRRRRMDGCPTPSARPHRPAPGSGPSPTSCAAPGSGRSPVSGWPPDPGDDRRRHPDAAHGLTLGTASARPGWSRQPSRPGRSAPRCSAR